MAFASLQKCVRMQPIDGTGRPICGRVYATLLDTGHRLEAGGYAEARNTPNLFWRSDGAGITFFASMRGTSVIPIWEDTRPLFSWKVNDEFACSKDHTGIHHQDAPCPTKFRLRELLKAEMRRLAKVGIRTRLSFYEDSEPEGLFFGDEDKYCAGCGADTIQLEPHEAECTLIRPLAHDR